MLEEKMSKNIRFQKRFKERAEIKLSLPLIMQDIYELRKKCNIPIEGFKKIDITFKEWLTDNRKNDYKEITKSFNECEHINARPKYFLRYLAYQILDTDDQYPDYLYLLVDDKNYFRYTINEKPFPGIVSYILRGKLLIPETNETQLVMEKGYIVKLRLGPNSTMEDIREVYDFKEFISKRNKNYSKNKVRRHKNHEEDIKLIQLGLSSSKVRGRIIGKKELNRQRKKRNRLVH